MASEEDNQHNDVVPIKLPAPSGWSKEFTPKKGSTAQRKEIVFISPTGEEIKNKKQLDQYLKSHPGGPSASEFDWFTGDSPRRSTRLSEKSKADSSLASQSPTKRQKKSSAKGAQENSNADAKEDATGNEDASRVEDKGTLEGSTVHTNNAVYEDVIQGKPKSEDGEMRTNARNETEKLNASVVESNNATTVVPDTKLEESKEASRDETKEASDAGKEAADGKVDIPVTASDVLEDSKENEEDERGKNSQQ